jgi:hypothetical protein
MKGNLDAETLADTWRQLLAATRQAVFASPALLAEYRRRHRWRWAKHYIPTIIVIVGGLTALVVGGLVGSRLAGWLSNPEVWEILVEQWNAGHGGRINAIRGWLIAATMVSTLVVALGAMLRGRYLLRAGIAYVALPCCDRYMVATRLRQSMRWCPVLLVFGGYLLPFIALHVSSDWQQLAIVYLTIAAHVGNTAGLFWLAAASMPAHWPDRRPLKLVIAAAIALASVGIGALFLGSEATAALRMVSAIAYGLPSGWGVGLVDQALTGTSPLGWWTAIPLGGTLLVLAGWLARGIDITEFSSPTLYYYPIFRRGFTNPAPPTEKSPKRAGVKQSASATADVIRKQVLCQVLASSHSWEQRGMVERSLARWFTPRQRVVLNWLYVPRQWTRAWIWHAAFFFPLWALFVAVRAQGRPIDGDFLAFTLVLAVICGVIGDMLAALPLLRERGANLLHPLFPASFRESLAVVTKAHLLRLPWRMLAMFPIVVVGATLDLDLWNGLSVAIIAQLVVHVVIGFCGLCVLVLNHVKRTMSWRMGLAMVCLIAVPYLPVIGLAVVGGSMKTPSRAFELACAFAAVEVLLVAILFGLADCLYRRHADYEDRTHLRGMLLTAGANPLGRRRS